MKSMLPKKICSVPLSLLLKVIHAENFFGNTRAFKVGSFAKTPYNLPPERHRVHLESEHNRNTSMHLRARTMLGVRAIGW
ncbi:MAG: hypothetical protein KatS3mg038_1216 [Candidatus Kapaibacterium sp.]|nr:MAG: hypothetical protein KatS3mg038_1216 [Candidatus Kapabacteria bacterium]